MLLFFFPFLAGILGGLVRTVAPTLISSLAGGLINRVSGQPVRPQRIQTGAVVEDLEDEETEMLEGLEGEEEEDEFEEEPAVGLIGGPAAGAVFRPAVQPGVAFTAPAPPSAPRVMPGAGILGGAGGSFQDVGGLR